MKASYIIKGEKRLRVLLMAKLPTPVDSDSESDSAALVCSLHPLPSWWRRP